MNELIEFTPERIGWLIWLMWALIGLLGALVVYRFDGRGTFLFNLIIGVVAAVLGGWLTTCFIGGGLTQLFLLSVLGAIFFTAAALWLVARLIRHFRRDEHL